MRKKVLPIMLCVLLVAVMLAGFAACNKDDDGIKITVWVGEGTDDLTKELIEEFNRTNDLGIKFNATVEMVSESVAAGDAIGKAESAADIFCFAQDQLARLVQAQMLMDLSSSSTTFIEENNDAESVEAAKIGGEVRAFPLTADNTFYMYYDKTVFKDEKVEDLKDLDAILADCVAAGRNFSMNLGQDGGWYAASFFYATGCVSEWTTDANGRFTSYHDTFKSKAGESALKAIDKVLSCTKYHASDKAASEFKASIPSAVVISGIWDYNAAKVALGDDLGMAPLPSFWVDENGNNIRDDGEVHQLVSFLGRKMLGIKPQKDAIRGAYLQRLAQFLTNKASQMKRFEAVGWGPSNKDAQLEQSVKDSECLKVIADSNTVPQGQYPKDWWSEVQAMAGAAKGANDAIRDRILTDYTNHLPTVKNS